MNSEEENQIDELASDLGDLKTTVEELEIDRPAKVDAENLISIKAGLDQAIDATKELEDQQEEAGSAEPKE